MEAAETFEAPSTSWVSEYELIPQTAFDKKENATAYMDVEAASIETLAAPPVNSGADLPPVPSKTEAPSLDVDGVCVELAVVDCDGDVS